MSDAFYDAPDEPEEDTEDLDPDDERERQAEWARDFDCCKEDNE
jgi:hypothetical protein